MEITGPLDQAREHGSFRKREIPDILPEVGIGRGSETMQAERAAPAQVHLVAVIREDLFLGELLFETQRHGQLRSFTLPILGRFEPETSRKLHAERGSALVLAAVFQIDIGRLQHAQRIEPLMLEESFVFHRDHRMHEDLGDFLKLHDMAVLPVAVCPRAKDAPRG